jgi:hypothetical protein
MTVGLCTSLIQRGHSGVGQYVFALVEALSRQNGRTALASDPALRTRLRVSGVAPARHFDWQGTASKTPGIYAAALEAETAPASVTVDQEALEN